MRIFVSLLFSLLISNCSNNIYQIRNSYLITIKSPKLKYSDIGLIEKSQSSILVHIFSLGKEILRLEIGEYISINRSIPIPLSLFNSKYLSSKYPPALLKNIFSGNPIFQGKNIVHLQNSFIQEFDHIKYRVSQSEIYFRDSKNRILIRLRRV